MGSEWGLRPLTIEQTTEDVTAIHRLAASRLPSATALSPPAAGAGTERRSAGGPVRRFMTRAGRAIGTAPNPGTSRGGALGVNGRPDERLERRANGTEAPARSGGGPRGSLVRMANASSAGDLRTPCERRGGR